MTGYDYIRQRWPEQAQRIIELAQRSDKATAETILTKDAPTHDGILAILFLWADTPEGWAYWHKLSVGVNGK